MTGVADLLMASSTDAIAIISRDPDIRIQALSRGVRQRLGSNPIGWPVTDLMPPGDGERIRNLLNRAPPPRATKAPMIPVRLLCQDGGFWPVAAELLSDPRGSRLMVRLHDRDTIPHSPMAALIHHSLYGIGLTSHRQNQATSQLLSLISHELRTPLNAILGFTELSLLRLADVEADTDLLSNPVSELRTLLQQIDLTGRDLNNTVSGLMTVAIFDQSNRANNGCEIVPLHLLEQVAVGIQDLVAEKRISLRLRDFCLRPLIRVDLDSTVQALTHLAHNAVKFAPPDSIVRLICQDEGLNVALIVTDRGPGLPAALSEALAAGTLESGGLGLTTVQAIAGLQGGSLSITSRPKGGTRAILRLPATGTAPALVAA